MIEISNKLKYFNSMLSEIDNLYQKLLLTINISESEFIVLFAILELGEGCSQKDISENRYINKKTINSAIKKLQKEEYLRLEAGKYPHMNIYLTDKGKEYIKTKVLPVIEVENKSLNNLPDEEFKLLIGCYERHMANFRKQVTEFSNNIKKQG